LAELHLRIARTVFDLPGEAQPWVGAITRYAPNADSLRAVLAAGLVPDEFIAWRDAGVDSWNIIPWSKTLSQADLTHDHLKQWRSAGHKAATLPLLVPYLSKDTMFDEILEAVQDWNAEDLSSVLESGVAVRDVIDMRRSGVSGRALDNWRSSGVPTAVWQQWLARDIPVDAAARFYPAGVDAATASEWLGIGLSSAEAVELLGKGVSIDAVRQWTEEDFSPSEAAIFISADTTIAEARQWLAATELSAKDIVDLIQKDVSLQQAIEFERRGIGSHQVSRTDAGLELDLDPWQEDPTEQLPKVIQPGRVDLTIWTTALGGDPEAHDVHFTWDGAHTADWYEDISLVNGLSFASSSPAHGMLAWPDGENVELTYTWDEMGLEGHSRLAGMAPTSGGSAGDPGQWVRLADAVIDFVLLTLGSGGGADAVEYLDAVGDRIVDVHELFRDYLGARLLVSQADFGGWLETQIAAGSYKTCDDED
jgi:hypothetical protein